jgi:hypothetical protein
MARAFVLKAGFNDVRAFKCLKTRLAAANSSTCDGKCKTLPKPLPKKFFG